MPISRLLMAGGLIGVLLLALVLGGGQQTGSWSEALIQIASLPLLGFAVWGMHTRAAEPLVRFAIIILIVAVALPLLQLIPLPPSIWASLPGREIYAAAYTQAGLEIPPLPLSLDPGATLRSLFSLLPPIAVFLATLLVSERTRERTTLLILTFAFFSAVLGLAQVAQGSASGLRPYAVTNPTEAVGLFANRNHFAALLYAVIPIAGAWAAWLSAGRQLDRIATVVLILVVLGALMVGVGMARSRAGVILAIVALCGLILQLRLTPSKSTKGSGVLGVLVLAGIAAAIIIALQLTSVHVLGRFETEIAEDLRGEMALTTLQAMWAYFPFGSGFGTFQSIYTSFEGDRALRETYVNQAHNDFLELALEGGLPVILALAAFLVWLGRAGYLAFTRDKPTALSGLLARAAVLAIILLLLHSIVDYPLRMTALASLFAFLCGLLVPARRAPDAGRSAKKFHLPANSIAKHT